MLKWKRLTILVANTCLCLAAFAQDGARVATSGESKARLVAVISDHHMGVGRTANGAWSPVEDFRWPRALKGFLDFVSTRGDHAVDLVIAGDLFELWQPPAHIKCAGASADLGCTIDEMAAIAEIVAREHAQELALLAGFAARGNNRVFLIPGNHDAALMLNPVWQKFAGPLRASDGRVTVVRSGVWASADGFIVVEHGHQIGADVNRYADWPQIVRSKENGSSYVVRPWGERFVQRVFNDQEAQYPIIDNLSPESAGVRYRMSDRGVWGTAADVARFLAFNLFETSTDQKTAMLGPPSNEPGADKWVISLARQRGHELFVAALPENDPFHRLLMTPGDEQVAALKGELDILARDERKMSEGEIRQLCDLAAANRPDGWQLCRPVTMNSAIAGAIFPLEAILRDHLRARTEAHKDMRVFVYGHTHKIQEPRDVAVSGAVSVTVANSGAFQRLINDQGFLQRIEARSWTSAEGLKRMTPEDLAPCYGVVLIAYEGKRPTTDVRMWWMGEDASTGALLRPGDDRCK